MGKDKFIWCRNCDEIHHVTRFDKAPVYNIVAGELEESPVDDWRAFMKRHEAHRLEPLHRVAEKHFPSGSVLDPMAVAYVEVTNGREHLLLRQMRKSIQEPLRFELITGRLIDEGMSLGVQENEIKKEMKYHFNWSGEPLKDDKIYLFIDAFRSVVRELHPAEIEVAGFSFDDDNVYFGVLETRTVDLLMVRCAEYFLPNELSDIRRFIDSHREGSDVMALVMRRQVSFQRPAA